jgi:hypothetical protein
MSEHTPTPITHLSPLAAALESSDRETLAAAFSRIADEALVLCDTAPTEQVWSFWLDLHETCHHEARVLLAPPEPKKRRWFW